MGSLLLQPAPSFEGDTIVNGSLTYLTLSNYIGSYLIVIFIPREFLFNYPPWLYAISDKLTEYRSINCGIMAISCVNEYFNFPLKVKSTIDKKPLKFPVVFDINGIIAKTYGSILEINVIYVGGLFIIDPHQQLRYYVDINSDFGPVINTLDYLKRLQTFDKMLAELEKSESKEDEVSGLLRPS